MEPTSPAGLQAYDDVVAVADQLVVGLDFDGVLSPIVEDPTEARIHPDAAATLLDLAETVRAVAVVTGRPARQALALGDLDEVGQAMADRGTELFVFGQYGNERWSSSQRRIVSPRPPAGLAGFQRDLPALLRRTGAQDAFVEEKGLAVAVHTRRMADPHDALERLTAPLRDLAERHGLVLEPGRNVVEVRGPGMHKGDAVQTLVEEQSPGAFLYAGDDLGDVVAFEAVARLREQGMPTLLVAVASDEQAALVALADVVVTGPAGVLDLLRTLAGDARARSGTASD
ncbi:MAG TPA: trehalose-phosphatase [Nocardioides sp.]